MKKRFRVSFLSSMMYRLIFFLCPALICVLPGGCDDSPRQDKEAALATMETPHSGQMVRIPGNTLTPSFWIDQTEVTQRMFEAISQFNPSHFKHPDRPVEQVSWPQAVRFCNARSRLENLEPCYDEQTGACDFGVNGYRLPTELEWETACRGRGRGPRYFDSVREPLGNHAWYRENSAARTQPVAGRKASPWGLYDLYGNVAEWCQDDDRPNGSTQPEETTEEGPGFVPKVIRGGSFRSAAWACQSNSRDVEFPGRIDGCFARDDIGFRCVRKVE